MKPTILFFDTEISESETIEDIGAVYETGNSFHSASVEKFSKFISQADFLCGHNIIRHDLKYILPRLEERRFKFIDTLYLSPLLFPERPYHALLKDDKLLCDELNNPLNDSLKAQTLFNDEVNAFLALDERVKIIYYCLLGSREEFGGFFEYLDYSETCGNISAFIGETFLGKICENAEIESLVRKYPVELAYSLALINTKDYRSVTPPWLIRNFPSVEKVIRLLRAVRCKNGCRYCGDALNIRKKLIEFFNCKEFRTYNGEPLQENAAQAAADGRSLLAVFPTGGGKSITFQLPALMAGRSERGLTVVISPLQSLMKDQVDSLFNNGISEAVTINGMLSPVDRANAIEHVQNGLAALLYISPEQLRSRSIERLLLSRSVVRFVIDEAHCFSAWGQDFRVDYLYIGDFIREYQAKKSLDRPIPVSCFTATAKQKVISDICAYFKEKLGLELELFTSDAERQNLHYTVLSRKTDREKYETLRKIISEKKCPSIVYVSRTRRTRELAAALKADGHSALPYNGKMDPAEKTANQEAFMSGKADTIVATSAFGMGVDKKDVGLVVHYDISDSLENYVQEAGRAGRDPALSADCYVLFNDEDLNKHFILLNQTKVSIGDIQQVWTALKNMMKQRDTIFSSALEIARKAGWDDTVSDVETRVKTSVLALEQAGYIKRGHNVPQVYATGIAVKNQEEARMKIEASKLFSDDEKKNSIRIIGCMISERSRLRAGNAESDRPETRIDHIADLLGLEKRVVINCVNLMRQAGILADSMDMSAYIYTSDSENRSLNILNRFIKLENFLLDKFTPEEKEYNLKELNEAAQDAGITYSNVKRINTLLNFLTIKEYISKERSGGDNVRICAKDGIDVLKRRSDTRYAIAKFAVEKLYAEAEENIQTKTSKNKALTRFSQVGILNEFSEQPALAEEKITLSDVEDALLYLSKIGSMELEGGFLVLYNALEITRLVRDNKIRYKKEDYRTLDEFYKHRIQQIHIVGEFANLMIKDPEYAMQFERDYFRMDFKKFISKYFKGERAVEIMRNISPEKYHKIVDELSDIQKQIINDTESKYIVVAAGPGSGKTRVLVHKLASLMMLEDAKHEQLLMLTFSHAAATEFKKRLIALIGNAANFVEIKTFHSYCFDLLGKIGRLDGADDIIPKAVQLIESGEAEQGRITKTVLLIDEAQDMDEDEYRLVRAIMSRNEGMRIIAVGDDDQNIYEWRGSSSKYMRSFIDEFGAAKYELTANYRSRPNIVNLAGEFAKTIRDRMKTSPITAVNLQDGVVEITRHNHADLEVPVVNKVIETFRGGKACVLTVTNEEALRVCSLLNKNGVRARLIQSLGKFKLKDLAEIRFFLKEIDQKLQTSVISNEIWENAKREMNEYFCGSECLENCNNLITDFAETHTYSKYRTDLEEFIGQSNYEDFYSDELDAVYVSTIHRSKGREFDNVYMLLNNISPDGAAESRKLYVGMTRAKNALYIHCTGGFFNTLGVPGIRVLTDNSAYPSPGEITLSLTHKDVVLSFFKDKKPLIFRLKSGTPLGVDGVYLTAMIGGTVYKAAKLSQGCVKTVKGLMEKGYTPAGGKVRFIVAWKGENYEEESAVILADLYMKKRNR